MGALESGLLDGFAEAVRSLLTKGFEPPLYWAAIGANGSIVAGEYQAGPDGTLLAEVTAEHIVGGTLKTPINFMFTDPNGQAANMVMGNDQVAQVS